MAERDVATMKSMFRCMTHSGIGMVLIPLEDRAVLAEGKLVAASGDTAPDIYPAEPKNKVFAGAAQVWVGYSEAPLSGVLNICQHTADSSEGIVGLDGIQTGVASVQVGGNTVVGDVSAATKACKQLAAGRTPTYMNDDGQKQSANNCGLESCRQMINAQRQKQGLPPISEDDLIDQHLKDNQERDFLEYYLAKYHADDPSARTNTVGFLVRKQEIDGARTSCAAARAARDDVKIKFYCTDPPYGYDVLSSKLDEDIAAGKVTDPNGNTLASRDRFDKLSTTWDTTKADYAKKAQNRDPVPVLSPDGKPVYVDENGDFNTEGRGRPVTEISPEREPVGGTTSKQQIAVLAQNDPPIVAHEAPQTAEEMERAVCNGQGYIASVDSGALWGTKNTGAHAVVVTGMEYDDDGHLVGIVYNDSAKGCHNSRSKDDFMKAVKPSDKGVVTDQPVW